MRPNRMFQWRACGMNTEERAVEIHSCRIARHTSETRFVPPCARPDGRPFSGRLQRQDKRAFKRRGVPLPVPADCTLEAALRGDWNMTENNAQTATNRYM